VIAPLSEPNGSNRRVASSRFVVGLVGVAVSGSDVRGRRRGRRRRHAAGGDQAVEVDRHRKDDGRALLVGDLAERLEVAQLQRRRRLADDVGGVLQRTCCLLLALRRDHLSIKHSSIRYHSNSAPARRSSFV